MNVQKECLKIQQKACEQKLTALYKLKHDFGLQQAIKKLPQSRLQDIQSEIDSKIHVTRLELRAIYLLRAYLRGIPRNVLECYYKRTSQWENHQIVSYMGYYIDNNTHCCNTTNFKALNIMEWLGITSKDC